VRNARARVNLPLVIVCLRTTDFHIAIAGLDAVMERWGIVKPSIKPHIVDMLKDIAALTVHIKISAIPWPFPAHSPHRRIQQLQCATIALD
jgi:hypothetical protein